MDTPPSRTEAVRTGTLVHEMLQLIADGWLSTSNRYLMVSRLKAPPFKDAVTFAADVPQWLREQMAEEYETQLRWGARVHGEHRTLTAEEFAMFKKLGGETA